MRIEIQLKESAALDLHKEQVEQTRDIAETRSNASELKKEIEEFGLKLEPVHPGETHPLLAPYFMIEVPDRQTAELVISRLTKNDIVESAYLRPEQSPP